MPVQKMTLLRRWFEGVWNEGREELMEELVAADVVCHGIGGPDDVARGLDAGVRPLYARLRGAFADINFTVEATLSEGDFEAARWRARMVHVGDDLGFPATQKPVTLTGMSFARVEGGKIVESWDNWDMLGLLNQLGAGMRERVVPVGGG